MILFDMKFKQEFEVYREIYKPEKNCDSNMSFSIRKLKIRIKKNIVIKCLDCHIFVGKPILNKYKILSKSNL